MVSAPDVTAHLRKQAAPWEMVEPPIHGKTQRVLLGQYLERGCPRGRLAGRVDGRWPASPHRSAHCLQKITRADGVRSRTDMLNGSASRERVGGRNA